MRKWYIYGAGGFGKEALDILSTMQMSGDWSIEFVVDEVVKGNVLGIPVTAWNDNLVGRVTIGLGEPAVRHKLLDKLESSSLEVSSVISAYSFVSAKALVGKGSIIAPFSSIQATANISQNVAVNTMAIVGHDVEVGASAVLSSQVNLGGGVRVGERTFVGMGSLVREGVTIGSETIIGMGSVVYKDIPDGVIAMGNPARVVKRNENRRVFGGQENLSEQ